jgi:hypothetical protein
VTNIVKPMSYIDPVVQTRLRVYADDRGFAQLTISRGDDPMGCIAVRIRDEALDELIDVLTLARDAAKQADHA